MEKEEVMEREKNKLKEMIARGEVALGTCVCGFSPAIIELAGFCGLDFCRIDPLRTCCEGPSVPTSFLCCASTRITPTSFARHWRRARAELSSPI
jgi:hypothetical protein